MYGEKGKLSYIDTDSFIVYIKIDDIHNEIAEDAKTKFDILDYELDKPLLNRKNKNVIGLG